MIRKVITRSPCLMLLVLICGVAGCGSDQKDIRVVLADLRFTELVPDSLDGLLVPELAIAQTLGSGWHAPGKNGAWTVGPEAAIDLYLMGHSLSLDLVMATSPELIRRDQAATVIFNDEDLGTFAFEKAWQSIELTVAVPDSLVRQGPNRIVLIPATTGWQDVEREFGLLVHRIRVTGELGSREQEMLAGAAGLAVDETDYALREAKEPPPPPRGGVRPDVLIVLLDAARADHFGCYGYHRDTTPFIDALAADGLVYEQVYSPSPTTLCATPSLLTGRNWCEHGVVRRGEALGTDLPTLAGILSAAGVHTLAVSDNPHVSKATACDRGFDEFYDRWRGQSQLFSSWYDAMEKTIGNLPPDKPSFAFIHMIPPHEPYYPGPRFDVFSDPTYDGPADGTVEYVLEIDRGLRSWVEEDRQHLVDLYDGNLLKGDYRTSQVVDLWRSRRPDRELVTIVLSDHGEAFGEHGRFSHNSTLYPEMLHIPLVIHPASWGDLLPPTNQLRSLADVMPMVLRIMAADLTADRTWPRHLLDVYEGRAVGRNQILLRTTSGVVGLRATDHLAVNLLREPAELFLVEGEGGGSTLRRLNDPLVLMNLIRTGTGILETRAATRQEVPRAVIDKAAAERLKSLGY